MTTIAELEFLYGQTFFDYQVEAMEAAEAMVGPSQRLCLYYKTGAGKSITALSCVSLWEHDRVVVVAPPATQDRWVEWGELMGVEVIPMSHARFRMKNTLLSRHQAVIVDEFHLLGGHSGQGWKKLDRLARGIEAPLLLLSATPNYNDADRVYCIQHILDPLSCRGGFLQFLYDHCTTQENPFGRMPLVRGFQRFADAAEYLASLPGVQYLEDDLVYTITDVPVPIVVPHEFAEYGLNRRRIRMVASQMEERHAIVDLSLINESGYLRTDVYEEIRRYATHASTPVLVFAQHSTVAEALGRSLTRRGVKHGVITGTTSTRVKQARLESFRSGDLDVLVGTASLATGTDGLDQVCDTLVILDDTDDDALRRQLIGRIMPRGADTDVTKKQVYRLVLQ